MVSAIASAAQTSSSALAPGIDPVRFEVMRHALLAITEEMGAPAFLSQNAQAPLGLGHLSNAIEVLNGFPFAEPRGAGK